MEGPLRGEAIAFTWDDLPAHSAYGFVNVVRLEQEPGTAQVLDLWSAAVPEGEQHYYDGMLSMMSMPHCSGHYRIWEPK